MKVAPINNIPGFLSLANSQITFVYPSVVYFSNNSCSATNTSSAPCSPKMSAKADTLFPNNTAVKLTPNSSASLLPSPNISKETFCNSPFLCSANTQTPL